MLNKWNYDPQGEVCYGQEIVYQKARDFLGDTVEDWGCGTCWAKRYFTNYKGIDGSPHPNVDVIADLTTYTSKADNILIRQVLENNYDWKLILANAVKSFQKKLCITIHTPMVETTKIICVYVKDVGFLTTATAISANKDSIPDISFRLQDILDYFTGLKVTIEEVPTAPFEYGTETLIYVEKV